MTNTIWCWSFFIDDDRFEDLNAARMSAAGDGWTEPILNFDHEDQNANKSG